MVEEVTTQAETVAPAATAAAASLKSPENEGSTNVTRKHRRLFIAIWG